jgi:hypothetical protein
MSDDYLWSGDGPRDPDVARLERLLGAMRPPDLPPLETRRPRTRITLVGVAASIAGALVLLSAYLWLRPAASPVSVSRLAGAPTIGGRAIAGPTPFRVGQWVETDQAGRVRADLADMGEIELAPNSRLRVVSAERGRYRVFLARGTLRVSIVAPPGRLIVDTATSTAVDLGCAFEITADDAGNGTLHVLGGWAAYAGPGHSAFVPAGAVCVTRPGLGPGTPHFENRSPEFLRAIDVIDTERDDVNVRQAIDLVVSEAGPDDAVTLWHLLSRVGGDHCDRVFDRLQSYAPAPAGVTRDGIRTNDRAMLERWWPAVRADATRWLPAWRQFFADPGSGRY